MEPLQCQEFPECANIGSDKRPRALRQFAKLTDSKEHPARHARYGKTVRQEDLRKMVIRQKLAQSERSDGFENQRGAEGVSRDASFCQTEN
jgi:hypothetical protein